MNIFINCITFFVAASSALYSLVDNSIIPLFDYYHTSKHIDPKKYSKTQYEAICEALKLEQNYLRIASYNMLFDRYDHLLAKTYRWHARLDRLLEILKEMKADIICFQELYPTQVKELLEEVDESYGFAGKLLDPGQEPREINGILYKKSRFSLQKCITYYISETPDAPSADPFSNEKRTLVEAHLLDNKTAKELACFSTQIAFGSCDSREYAANFILKRIEAVESQKPCLLAGDFNSFSPHVDDPHVPFFDGRYILSILTSKSLKNSRDAALIGTLGPISTYTNKQGAILPFQGTGTSGIILDHIFTSSKLHVLISGVQPAVVNGMYASDHFPVIADCIVK